MDLGYLPTNIEAINALVGGLPVGSGLLIYGPAEGGKTILELQMAFEILQAGHSVAIVDTEGSDHTYADWHAKFVERYKVDAGLIFVKPVLKPVMKGDVPVDMSKFEFQMDQEEVKKHTLNIYVFDIRELTDLLAFFGKPVDIEPSPNGKFSVKPQPGWKMNPALSALGVFLKARGCHYLAVDSLTNPLKAVGTEQQNLPARAQLIGYLMTSIQGLSEKLGLATVMVSHEGGVSNTDPFAKFKHPEPLGGQTVLYNVKYSVYLSHKPGPRTPSTEKYKPPTREFWVARHPSRQPWTMYRFIQLTATGFVDQ